MAGKGSDPFFNGLLDPETELAMFEIDWTNLELYHYLMYGGGGVAVLALLLYFLLPKGGARIPAGVIGTVGGLVAGVALGVIGMATSGYQLTKENYSDPNFKAEAAPVVGMKGGGPPAGMMGGGGMVGGKAGGKGFGGKGKGFGAPSEKAQLAVLVGKLDQLTNATLTLKLTDEQRATIREQLKDLSEQEEITDEDAKKRLDAILDSLKDQRPMLEAAGYFWPGTPFPKNAPAASNPFRVGPDSAKLNSLQEKLKPGLSKKSGGF
jgi:hypothetical protein